MTGEQQERYEWDEKFGAIRDRHNNGEALDEEEECDRLNAYERTVAELRRQLRHAWAHLDCRCVFNEQDEKTAEDAHCPYHG